MKRNAFDESRDQRAAEDSGRDRALMCAASGCPNAWAYRPDGTQGTCSAHAWADPRDWPEVTQGQQWDQTERARERGEDRRQWSAPALTLARKREILDTMRSTFLDMRLTMRGQDWAAALEARELAGEKLTPAQRAMWRDGRRRPELAAA